MAVPVADDTDGKRACVVGCNQADRTRATWTARVPERRTALPGRLPGRGRRRSRRVRPPPSLLWLTADKGRYVSELAATGEAMGRDTDTEMAPGSADDPLTPP